MIKSITRTIRIDKTLFDLVMSANPSKTFTEIVRDLLNEKYGFSSCTHIENTTLELKGSKVIDPNITFIENEIDKRFCSCTQDKDKLLSESDNDFFVLMDYYRRKRGLNE